MGGYFIIHQVIFPPLLIQNYHFKKSFYSLAPPPLATRRSMLEPRTQSLDARTQIHGAQTLPHCVLCVRPAQWCVLLWIASTIPTVSYTGGLSICVCYNSYSNAYHSGYTVTVRIHSVNINPPPPAVPFGKTKWGRITTRVDLTILRQED